MGCAPCQPFSTYSLRYTKKGPKDEKWKLLYYFRDLVKEIKPDIISMENVPQLVKKEVFKDFVKGLEAQGYHVSWQIVNCADHGVPQSRSRLVLLASKLGDISLIPPLYTEENYITVKDAIGSLPQIKVGWNGGNPHQRLLLSFMDMEMEDLGTQSKIGHYLCEKVLFCSLFHPITSLLMSIIHRLIDKSVFTLEMRFR